MRGLALILAAIAVPAAAEGILDDASATAAMLSDICVTDTLDFAGIFAAGTGRADGKGLPAVTKTDKVAMFGNPAGSNLVFSREIDAIACALRLPPPTGTQAYYETLRDVMSERITTVYPKALSVDADLASPHEEKHDWVFSNPADRHFAATLTWQVEDGVMLGIGYRQIYE